MMQARGMSKAWWIAALTAVPAWAWAQSADPKRWQLNMTPGVTPSSHAAYEAHMWVLWICVIIGVIVFAAMGYAMFKFRKSQGAVPDTEFTHSTKLEVIWTAIPVLILVGLAFPATSNLIKMYDTRNAAMTVKVTGYQWMWKYEYLGEGVSFTSRLDTKSEEIRQSGKDARDANHPHYLLDVDNPLVLPVGTKVRFVITADDVLHAWWMPAFGIKQDAIPGIINESWAQIDTPGVYRGQCAELCGKDHGFMPIVVKAVSQAEFAQWMAQQKAKNPAPAAEQAASALEAASASPAGTGTASPAIPDAQSTPAVPPVGPDPAAPASPELSPLPAQPAAQQ